MITKTFTSAELNRLVGILFEAEQALTQNNRRTRFAAVLKLTEVTDTLNALVPDEFQKWAR